MKKGTVFLSAAGLLALLLGAGLAWWQASRTATPSLPLSAGAASITPASPSADLLQRLATGSLPAPAGKSSKLVLDKPQLVIVNFWATWCPPCVEEIPELNALAADASFSKQTLIAGIAIDNPSNVAEFLLKNPINYPVGLAGLDGGNWMRAMGNNTGGLPFTVILDANGTQLFSKAGKTSAAELRDAVANIESSRSPKSASKPATSDKP